MRFSTAAAALLLPVAALAAARSSKRGLLFIPKREYPEDNAKWVQTGSDLTWYYNYNDLPSPAFAGIPQDRFEFVPMMWGVDTNNPESTAFHDNVKAMREDQKINITHVLGF